MCRHKLSSQCALHKHHNLNNLGIRQGKIYSEKSILFFKLFGKIDFQIHKNLKNRLMLVFGKIDFHYAGEVTHPNFSTLLICIQAGYQLPED